jgi:DNA-binding transcriptional MocR family regulator
MVTVWGFSMPKTADRSIPRYQELADELTQTIRSGRLPAGSSLPSLRECANQRKLSLNTVNAAYRLLEDSGLIAARPQSGFYVCSELAAPEASFRRTTAKDVLGAVQVDLMTAVAQAQQQPGTVDLAFAGPKGKNFYPSERLARLTGSVLRRRPDLIAAYAMPPGSALLREQIAARNIRLGMDLTPDCVILTHGTMEALNLALRAVTRPGELVGVEAPSFFYLYPMLSSLGLKAIEIPTHPKTGLDVDSVERLLMEKRISALVAMPTVHNPLGCSMPVEAKLRLAKLLNQYKTPLIEDVMYAELQYNEPLEPIVKSFDPGGWVIACGGFSKTLSPDYRIGWIVAGRFSQAVQQLRFTSSAAESALLCETVGQFLKSGGYEQHLRSLRRLYSTQVSKVRGLIAQFFPLGTRATQPTGGFVLWIELPPQIDSLDLYHAALERGVIIMPGQVYSKGPRYRHCMRIACCQEIDDRFIGAVRTLGEVATDMVMASAIRNAA